MNKLIIFLCFVGCTNQFVGQNIVDRYGALIRSDTLQKKIYLNFTGHDFDEGFEHVLSVLDRQKVSGSFFLTGDFIRNHSELVKIIAKKGHFVGAHSDKHLLYCDWVERDSLLHSEDAIKNDISQNLRSLKVLGIYSKYFMAPYEWYNRKVVEIAQSLDQITVNFSSGTRSNADYTTPEMSNYISSLAILQGIYKFEKEYGMNGFHLLIHPGTNPLRKDKLYFYLEEIIVKLKERGYQFSRFD